MHGAVQDICSVPITIQITPSAKIIIGYKARDETFSVRSAVYTNTRQGASTNGCEWAALLTEKRRDDDL